MSAPLHEDAGLQPERTALAWGRTMLLLVVTSCLFLRWYPYHGTFVIGLVVLALLAALAIWLTQGRRYRRSARAIDQQGVQLELTAVLSLSATVGVLALLGIYCVLWLS